MPPPGKIVQLTAAQEGMWAAQRLVPVSPLYNAAEYVRIDGDVDLDVLAGAVTTVVSSVDGLHARIVDTPIGPVQQLSPPSFEVLRVDLTAVDDPEATAMDWMRADAATVVDLAEGPLFAEALLYWAGTTLWYQRVHHIAADGFAFAQLAARVAETYRTGRHSGFGTLADVLADDEAYARERRDADHRFWTRRLAGAGEPAAFGGTSGVGERPLRVAGTALVPVGHGDWTGRVVAAVAALLHSRTGATEAVVGLAVANRLGSVTARVPCTAVNTVPIRLAVPPGCTLDDLVTRAADEVRRTRPHHRYRVDWLRRDLGRVGGGRRLYGPLINILPFGRDLDFGTVRGRVHRLAAGPVEDVTVEVEPRPTGLAVVLDAARSNYHPDTVSALHADVVDLLARTVTAPRTLVRPPVRARVVLDGGAAPTARPVLDRISAVARRWPHAVAVDDGRTTTYRELLASAERLAGRLRAAGAGPGRLVAVMAPHGRDGVVAVLATLLAGAAYLPLDPAAPPAHVEAVLDEASIVSAVVADGLADRVPRGVPVLTTDGDGPSAPLSAAGADDLAYVIYTSGSTGLPNGVRVDRGALDLFVAAAGARYGPVRGDRVLQCAPAHFDANVEELFLTLCAGATLVCRPDAVRDAVPRFLQACGRSGVTVLDLPTALWHEVARAVGSGQAALPSAVRTVVIGGEAARADRLAMWRAAVGDRVRLVNTYGPTEATVVATAAELRTEPVIGTPLAGTRVLLADSGELLLAGRSLAAGYLDRPELEAERFTTVDGERVYRTGDTAALTPDGALRFLGRIDDEIKVSGFRVVLGGVQAVALTCPGVCDAAVLARTTPAGGTRLECHVVVENPTVSPERVRTHLAARLPGYAVPADIMVRTTSLPRTSSGKLDREALTVTSRGLSSSDPMTVLVSRVWADVLGTPPADDDADFFASGGQSLQAIQVATRLSAVLDRDVPVSVLLRHATLSGLAAALRGDDDTPDDLDVDLGTLPVGTPPPGADTVVVTGATGFVGTHLAAELAGSGRPVVCLVRAGGDDAAAARLRDAFAARGLSAPQVVVWPADVSAPKLGLAAGRWDQLVSSCRTIFHCAAAVDLLRGHSELRAVNVDGTREVLRLAAAAGADAHLLSTLAVGPATGVPEGFVAAHPGLRDGYQRSKWAAEQLAEQAMAAGVRVWVHRLGRVAGPRATGTIHDRDLVWHLLRAAITAGGLPDVDWVESWTPADDLARALVHLAGTATPGVYHLASEPVRMSEMFRWVRDYGYRLPVVPPDRWRRIAADPIAAALVDMLHVLTEVGPVCTDRTRAALGSDRVPPGVDRALVHRHLDYAVRTGWLPGPSLVARSPS